MSSLLVSGSLAFSSSLVLTAVLARVAPRLSWGDGPTLARKLQDRPVPPVGGAAILCGATTAWLATGFGAPFGLAPAAVLASLVLAFAVGTLDDMRVGGLGALAKLALQAAATLPLAVAAALRLGEGAAESLAVLALAVLAALAAMNLANTFDHADGALGGISTLGLLLAGDGAPAGALAGFLPWNLDARPGRRSAPTAYLGDAGSHLVGLLLLLHPPAWPVFLLPALDLARLAVVRNHAGSKPWVGDRRHVSHLLAASGLSPRRVVLRLLGASAPACAGALLARGLSSPWFVAPGLFASALAYARMVRAGGREAMPAAGPAQKHLGACPSPAGGE